MIYSDWPAPDNIKAINTTRVDGVSFPPYDSFNLTNHVGVVVTADCLPNYCATDRVILWRPFMLAGVVWLRVLLKKLSIITCEVKLAELHSILRSIKKAIKG